MEKKYISENRYKKNCGKKRRDIKSITKNVSSNNTKQNKQTNVKTSKSKIKKKASVKRETRMRRRNVLSCIILLILIAVISRAILKEEGEPFIPIYFGSEENDQVITIGVITTEDLLSSNTNNVILKELGYYSNHMLLTINADYSLTYDALENIEKKSNKEYILNLNKSKEFNANSVKQILESYVGNTKSPYYSDLKEIDKIIVGGERKLSIILKQDDPYFIYNLAIPISKTDEKEYVKTSDSSSTKIVYERTRNASKEAPARIVVKRYKDMYEGVEAYKKEEINFLVTNQKNVQNILGKYEYNISTYRNGETVFLFLNNKSKWLEKEEIRKAVAYSIDRDKIVKDVMQSAANIIDLPYIYDVVKYKYDIYAAENLLLSNGYKKVNKVYTKQNEQVSLKLLVNKSDEEKVKIATAIKNNLNSVGIKVTIEKISAVDIEKRIEKGTYDLVLTSVNLNNKPNIDFLKDHLYVTEETKMEFKALIDATPTNLSSKIKNVSNAMSNDISCIGIIAKTNYVIYSKEIVGISDVSYLNLFKSLIEQGE